MNTAKNEPRTRQPVRGSLRLSKKYYFFDKGICGLTAAHAPSDKSERRARLQAEKYFLSRTCRLRK